MTSRPGRLDHSNRATPADRLKSEALRPRVLRFQTLKGWNRRQLAAAIGAPPHTLEVWLADGYLPARYHDAVVRMLGQA